MPALRWTSALGSTLLGMLLLLVLGAAYYVGGAALDKNVSGPAKLFLVALALAAVGVAVFTERRVLNVRCWRSLTQPRPVAALYSIFLVFLTTIVGILPLIEPRSVNTSDLDAGIERIKQHIDGPRATQAHPPVPRITQKLPGLWGEQDCAVTFRFAVRDEALIVDAERRPPGTSPFRLVARITGSRGDVMEVRGLEPREAEGIAATFTYESAGDVERLLWDDQISPHPSELERCA